MHWKGYPVREATWERQSIFPDLVESFARSAVPPAGVLHDYSLAVCCKINTIFSLRPTVTFPMPRNVFLALFPCVLGTFPRNTFTTIDLESLQTDFFPSPFF